jgi:hypothetical protein
VDTLNRNFLRPDIVVFVSKANKNDPPVFLNKNKIDFQSVVKIIKKEKRIRGWIRIGKAK